MTFDRLPKVIKNLVCDFAYESNWEQCANDLTECELLKEMNLSSVFVRYCMWSKKYRKYIPSPMLVFEPITNYAGRWEDIIDWHSVEELLFRLDFRRKFVFRVATRHDWRKLFSKNWKNVLSFDRFYRFLLCTRVPCFKPLWKPMGFDSIKSYRSPYVSGRWYLHLER